MGDDVLNMSLDDIIKAKSAGSSREASGGGGRGGNRRGRRQNSRPEDRLKVTIKNDGLKPRSGQNRRRGRGGSDLCETDSKMPEPSINVQARRGAPPLREAPRDMEALDGNASWKHDLFSEDLVQRPRRVRPAQQGSKLLITNLDFKVSDEDMRELFENCGSVIRAAVLYDRSGRSEEAAEVVFQRREDALAAMKRYNNLALDNKPMKIELVENDAGLSGNAQTLSSGIRVGGGGASGGGGLRMARQQQQSSQQPARTTRPTLVGVRGRSRTVGGGQGGGNRQARGRGATVSQADLDQDLDSYMATD